MSEQQRLVAESGNVLDSVEEHRFEPVPIRGYPELRWNGKRQFRSTRYYPAQLKEIHGPDADGWRNKIYWGDNLQVMSHLLKEYRGQVQLVYIDPPFDSKADYKRRIAFHGNTIINERTPFEEKQYTDIWTNDEYLQFMFERLVLIKELLSETGCIYLHCDHRKEHHLRVILDEVFGPVNFLNKISWRSQVARGAKVRAFYLPYSTHYLAIYAKNRAITKWNRQKKRIILTAEEASEEFMKDEHGFFRTSDPGSYSFQSLCRLYEEGRLYAPYSGEVVLDRELERAYCTNGGNIGIKYYLTDLGNGMYAAERALDNLWDDVPGLGTTPGEDLNYPTQKTEALLKRVILMSSNPGDLVFDCFMGSGTTQAVAMKLGRRFIGADINLGAVQITSKRLIQVAKDIEASPPELNMPNGEEDEEAAEQRPTTFYTGFEVYNVNHYDIFRNPVEAKDLLIEALELQRLQAGHLFDGERDGRLWKIMPVNRIATRADLGELISSLDYKAFERRRATNPHQPVERVTLVCMGHEPDLAAHLQQETQPYRLDIEIVDILRDRGDLQFKRDAEASVGIEDGELVIHAFYPMNLLQKLSHQKEEVEEWRELVESVMVDWNYDGGVLQPAIVDIPDKNELVTGRYPVPDDAGTVRVKITDLLSESLEVVVDNG